MTHDEVRDRLGPIITERTQTAVAAEASVPQSNLSAWLAGKRPLSDDALARVALACGYQLTHGYRLARRSAGKAPSLTPRG